MTVLSPILQKAVGGAAIGFVVGGMNKYNSTDDLNAAMKIAIVTAVAAAILSATIPFSIITTAGMAIGAIHCVDNIGNRSDENRSVDFTSKSMRILASTALGVAYGGMLGAIIANFHLIGLAIARLPIYIRSSNGVMYPFYFPRHT